MNALAIRGWGFALRSAEQAVLGHEAADSPDANGRAGRPVPPSHVIPARLGGSAMSVHCWIALKIYPILCFTLYPIWLFRTPSIMLRNGCAGDVLSKPRYSEIVVSLDHLSDDPVLFRRFSGFRAGGALGGFYLCFAGTRLALTSSPYTLFCCEPRKEECHGNSIEADRQAL